MRVGYIHHNDRNRPSATRLRRAFLLGLICCTTGTLGLTDDTDPSQSKDGRDGSSSISPQLTVGTTPVADILKQLGARQETTVTVAQLQRYEGQFDFVDQNHDGRHSKSEYIDKANYMSPEARRGIFGAADSTGDGYVTKAEYILNRIITDESKSIMQAMDDDSDHLVTLREFLKHVRIVDAELAEQVFDALDVNGNGELLVPEYLRVWGLWARANAKSAEERIAVRRSELSDSEGGSGEPSNGGRSTEFGGPGRERRGPPSRGFGPPSVDTVFQRFDSNKDGKLAENEFPEFVRQFILPADSNDDGFVTRQELEAARGAGGRANPGARGRPGFGPPGGVPTSPRD